MRTTLWTRTAPLAATLWQRLPLIARRLLLWQVVPKFLVGVCGVCLNEQGQALLLRHRFHKEGLEWGLPGGWMARGEAPALALRREILEETGLAAEVVAPLVVDGDGAWVEIIYLCRVPTEIPRLQAAELTDWCWCDPARDLTPMLRSHHRALRLAAAHPQVAA